MINVLIYFLLFCNFSVANQPADFKEEFKQEIEQADEYYNKYRKALNAAAEKFETDSTIVSSIIYPELVRYSLLRDFFETKALETLYIGGGEIVADFSIGLFQMKPSFVESMEAYVSDNKETLSKYILITKYDDCSVEAMRAIRLDRLKSIKWQIIYINCFYSIVSSRFIETEGFGQTEKIRFFATAYNHDFMKSQDEILKWSNIKSFPYGTLSGNNKYNYADISVYFYNQRGK